MENHKIARFVILSAVLSCPNAWAGDDLPTKFNNLGTVANTRHNMTQRPRDNTLSTYAFGEIMDPYRNNYGQVCVYCHTPHGANQNIQAPLWNRTVRTTTYTLYNQQSLSQGVTQPGPNSLTCLSCHDGQTAVDSIVNMPGSGGYNAALALDPSAATSKSLLDAWNGPAGSLDAGAHAQLADASCLACHSRVTGEDDPLKILKLAATDFTAAAIGTDLSNDHPVGVKLPGGSDWKTPDGTRGNVRFFDTNGSKTPDKDELRFYDSGGGYMVECASCHDPHGVPGVGGTFNPTFLRKTNDGSAVCLTCHIK